MRSLTPLPCLFTSRDHDFTSRSPRWELTTYLHFMDPPGLCVTVMVDTVLDASPRCVPLSVALLLLQRRRLHLIRRMPCAVTLVNFLYMTLLTWHKTQLVIRPCFPRDWFVAVLAHTRIHCRSFCHVELTPSHGMRTYLLTPRSRVLEKLTGFQSVKKFPALYGTQRFITAFTTARHLYQS